MIASFLSMASISACAATKTWDGGASTANWADAANWNADGLPASTNAVLLDNSGTNPIPQINAQAGANCGTLTIDGAINSTFLNYGGATPYPLNLFGASANPALTGPLINITSNAPATLTANKINFQLRTHGELAVAAGKTLVLSNSFISENGTRNLTKSGAGTIRFSGSGSLVSFTGGLNMAEGIWNAGNDTRNLPVSGIITFTNPSGVAATITSTNSHSIEGLAGGNSNSEIYTTGTNGLTITGNASTTYSGRIRGTTHLNHAGAGMLTLNGSNTFNGSVTVSSGTLKLGSSGTIHNVPSISIVSGAIFDVSPKAAGFTLESGKSLSGGGSVAGKLSVANNATLSPNGTLTVTNDLTLATGARLALTINSPASHDSITVTNGNVSLAATLDATATYPSAIGDIIYLLRNTGPGTTTGTLSGIGDGGKIDIGGKWWRVSFTSDSGGAGFLTNGPGNDVAIQRIDDPSPAGMAVAIIGATQTASVQLQLSWTDNASNETGYRIHRVLADGSLLLVATLPANTTTFAESAANHSSHSYAVQAFNAAGDLGDLIQTTPFAAGSTNESRQTAMLDWNATTVPNLSQFGGGPHRVGRTAFFHASARIMRGETATGLGYITTAIEDASAENSNAGFSMWPGMDAWMRWNHLFPQSLRDRYQEVYTTSDLYDNSATPNQRFMTCTASYLANSVWGPSVNSVSQANYSTGDPTGKTYVLNEIERAPFRGFSEHDSNSYLLVTLSPMETLAQFAPDADVRHKARMALDWGFANAAGHWLNGHWGVAASRYATGGVQNSLGGTGLLWWLRFGGPTTIPSGSHACMPFIAPEFPGILPEIEAASRDRLASYRRRSFATRRVSGIDAAYFKQAWMNPRYTLWSQVEGSVTFNSDGSINLVNLNPAFIQDGYQGQRWALAWDSPPGNDAKLRITSPTTYSGTTDGISVWEDTLQHQDTMIAVYNMPAGGGGSTGNDGNWANEFLRGHIPGGWQAITDEAASTGRIFIHYDSVLVALYLNRTFSWDTDFTIPNVNKAALAIETAAVNEFPQATPADRLAAFRSTVLSNSLDVSAINDTAPRFVYTNRHGHTLDLTFGLAGKINGVTVDYQSWPLIEDPWMSQSQNGHLHISGPNRVVTSNFHDWTQTINHRPAVSSNAAVPATTGASVEIDLTTRVMDPETHASQLHFTVSDPSNGSVTLLPDGKTARFIPTASGPATFDFSASDRGLHPRAVLHYDFEISTTHDASLQRRHATQTLLSNGTAALAIDSPAVLGSNSTQSLRLTEASPNAAKVSRLVTRSNLEMSNGSWTFATWFKRATRNTDDFIFYIGAGDGFSGNGDELQLRCGPNSDTLRLEHYNSANTNDLTLVSPATAAQNVWHHAAITFEKNADNTGTIRLYLNGTQVGVPTTVTWSLRQDLPLILGGHASSSTTVASRYFNGWLDDAALFRGALTPEEISRLAQQSVATFGGLETSATVSINALTHQENWRQTHFGTTANTGEAADLADPNHDGEPNLLEFATGQNPHANTLATTTLKKDGDSLDFTYTRSHAAIGDGVTFIVEWSETLAPGSWSSAGVIEEILADNGTVQTVKAGVPGLNADRRFVRLRVSTP